MGRALRNNSQKKKSPVRVQTKCGLDFPPSRVRKLLAAELGKGTRISKSADVALTAAVNVIEDAFMTDCTERFTEKERSKEHKTVRASHCAAALADPTTTFHGVFPSEVAGVFVANDAE